MKITFKNEGKTVEIDKPENLRELALRSGIALYRFPDSLLNCRGKGFCKTCRVKVDPPASLTPPTAAEEALEFQGPSYRLACQVQVTADIAVTTRPKPYHGWMRHRGYRRLLREIAKE